MGFFDKLKKITSNLFSGFTEADEAFFEELVTQDPDMTLFELRDALAMAEGLEAHHSSIAAALLQKSFSRRASPFPR